MLMSEAKRERIRRKYDTRGPDGLIKRHPKAGRKPNRFMKSGLYVPMMPEATPQNEEQIEQAWAGMLLLMEFFGGDTILAARHLGLHRDEIVRWVKRGFMTLGAAIAAEKMDYFGHTAETLLPYITPEKWAKARKWRDANSEYGKEHQGKRNAHRSGRFLDP